MKRLLLMLIFIAACGGADTKDEPETVIGTPPSPKDDPFFFVAMPAEAVPAAATGTIGDGEGPEPKASETPGQEESATASKEADTKPAAQPDTETVPDEPRPSRTSETARPAVDGSRCFSCVRICPETISDADCGDDYDTICGWGRSADRSVAADIATGECDAALDLARSGSRYSRISGSCPAASCQ